MRLPRLLGSLTVLVLLTGCVPGVTWLPDSSGVIFTAGDHQLLHYDIPKRAQRVIVADTKTNTIWPAVSPDGRRVAVARFVTNRDTPDTVELIIHDLEGKVVQRSSTFLWGPGSGTSNMHVSETFLFWSPKSEHVVVLAGSKTGLYDVRNDGLILLDDALPLVINTTPFRPDGEGFLFCRKKDDVALTYHFVNWEGREYNLDMKPLPAADGNEWMRFPLLYNAHWEANTAVVRHAHGSLRLDAGKLRGELRNDPANEPVEEVRQQAAFANGARLRVVGVRDPGNQRDQSHYRVEILGQADAPPRVVVGRMENCVVFPSPDRRLVALRGTPEGKGDRIIVVNDRGEIVAEIVPGG